MAEGPAPLHGSLYELGRLFLRTGWGANPRDAAWGEPGISERTVQREVPWCRDPDMAR